MTEKLQSYQTQLTETLKTLDAELIALRQQIEKKQADRIANRGALDLVEVLLRDTAPKSS